MLGIARIPAAFVLGISCVAAAEVATAGNILQVSMFFAILVALADLSVRGAEWPAWLLYPVIGLLCLLIAEAALLLVIYPAPGVSFIAALVVALVSLTHPEHGHD